jgi:internalin A
MSPEEDLDYREALKRIREAEETGATDLDLSRLSLTALPAGLASLTSLKSLNLVGCRKVRDLTPLSSLTSLQSLDLHMCAQIDDLTPLASLTTLRSLSLFTCGQISNLTPLASLTALQSLDLTWSWEITDLTPLTSLIALRSLKLFRCRRITDLTPLVGLTALQELDLSHCRGAHRFAPLEILLSTMKEIRLFKCQFDDLPAEVYGEYGENVLAKVRAHYADVRAGETQDIELKVFMLGNGGAGKTQLCRRLGGLSYDPSIPTTHGIQLSEMTLELEDIATPIRLNLWDFGGQEVYHGSHALFLQGRAVFSVLWTPELEAQT